MIGKIRASMVALLLAAVQPAGIGVASAAGDGVPIERQAWTFGGLFGKFDDAQLQRGFKVYTDVCARCHGIKRLQFRNLVQPGGPGFSAAQAKSLAADKYQVDDVPDEEGKIKKRPAILADSFPPPFPNEQAARYSQNGALPPDLSLMAKARGIESGAPFYRVPDMMLRDIVTGYQEGGADYIYAYLRGFGDPPANMKLGDFMNYNKVFPGHQTAMANPFIAGNGAVKYDDATPATVENYARDVVAFLSWAADPSLEERKRMGLLVLLYIAITAVLLGLAKRRIWRSVH